MVYMRGREMKRASVVGGILIGFLLVNWAVAIVRAGFLPSRWDPAPAILELAPEPANDAPSPDFQALDHLLSSEELVAYHFVDAYSIAEMNDVRRAVHQEHISRWKAASGPLPAWLPTMLAALVDPAMLTLGAGAAFGIFVVGGGGLLIGVAAGAAGLSASELTLQVQRYTRPEDQMPAVLTVCAAMFLIAWALDWLTRSYGRQLWRPVYVLTRGTWGVASRQVARSWRALEDEADR
jgi:hypothetical protein